VQQKPPPLHVWKPVQAMQAAPPVPHTEFVVPAWHMPLASQQPLGQLVLLHTHWPLLQVWPEGQTCPHAPQLLTSLLRSLQLPPQQPGVVPGQVVHVPPLMPQVLADCAWQVPPASQQPLGQLVLLQPHWPLLQVWPGEHWVHVPPLVPQAVTVLPA
jgi:hypothetical protein